MTALGYLVLCGVALAAAVTAHRHGEVLMCWPAVFSAGAAFAGVVRELLEGSSS